MELTLEEQLEYQKILDSYAFLLPFMESHKKMTYLQFDYALVNELTLFRIDPNFSFETLDQNISAIIKALPAIKNIFAKPFIHLKDESIIMPTEAVRLINNQTIQHISSHSELWTDLTEDGIKPERLLTRVYQDNYGIYENLVFCQTINQVLSYARSNIKILKDLIFTNQTIGINLLERVNHLSYFLALGKLHTGYSRNFDLYYNVATKNLNKLMFVTNCIVPRLKRPVYKANQKQKRFLKVRKTNILAMHKDYHQIFKLAKYFESHTMTKTTEFSLKDLELLQKEYTMYCIWMTMFSIGHFNFSCEEEKEITFSRFSMKFQFKEWEIQFKTKSVKKHTILLLNIKKDKEYQIVCIPSVLKNNDELMAQLKEEISAEEYHIFSPFEDIKTPVRITDIESFRRIQQILLRGMIYADTKRKDCPFCQQKLEVQPNEDSSDIIYVCRSCRTEIVDCECPTTKKTYTYTGISGFSSQMVNDEVWLKNRKVEAQLYFRNITDITEDLEVVCPHCKQIHRNSLA